MIRDARFCVQRRLLVTGMLEKKKKKRFHTYQREGRAAGGMPLQYTLQNVAPLVSCGMSILQTTALHLLDILEPQPATTDVVVCCVCSIGIPLSECLLLWLMV